MAKLENLESLTGSFEEIKSIVQDIKTSMMSGDDCNNQFYSVMQTLENLVAGINTIMNEKNKTGDEFAILQTNILEVKKELASLTNGIDEIINNQLGQLISKLTEKVNRLEILTNNTGIDQHIIMDTATQVEKKLSLAIKDSTETLYSQGAASTESIKKDIIEVNENLKDCTEYIEKAVKAISDDSAESISADLTLLGSTVEKTSDNLKRSIIDIFSRIQENLEVKNSGEPLDTSSLNESIEMLKTGMYNLNVNTEQKFSKLNKLIEELDFFTKLQNFANLKDLPAIGDLKNTLKSNLNQIVDDYSYSLQTSQNKEELTALTQQFRRDVYNSILTMLGNVSEFLLEEEQPKSVGENKYPSSSFSEKLEDIKFEIQHIKSSLLNGKESELGDVVRECAKSIIENSEPDRTLIKNLLTDIKKNISVLQSGDEETDYTYSMQDIESDVAKIRIYLNELSQGGLSVDTDEFSAELNSIVVLVDSIKQQLNKIDECDLSDTMSRMQEDIVSVSTRVNKLLLTSDNSYNMVEGVLKEFKILSEEIDEQLKAISSTNKFKNLEESLNAVKDELTESNNYNNVINQSLILLAEWVDSAGEMLTNISEKQNKLDSVDEIKILINSAKEDLSENYDNKIETVKTILSGLTPVDYSEKLNIIESKLEEQMALAEKQEERLNKLDEKLSTIIEFVAKNDSSQLSNKIDEIDLKMEKLNNSIEKLTSFINED